MQVTVKQMEALEKTKERIRHVAGFFITITLYISYGELIQMLTNLPVNILSFFQFFYCSCYVQEIAKHKK